MEVYQLDLTGESLPPGVVLREAPGKGLGLFASREFIPGECVYEYRQQLFRRDTLFRVETDFGRHDLSAATHCSGPFSLEELSGASSEMLTQLADLLQVERTERRDQLLERIWRLLTDGGTKLAEFTGFDAFINHSSDPNCVYADDPHRVGWYRGEVAAWWDLIARRRITVNEELTVDYAAVNPRFAADADWA